MANNHNHYAVLVEERYKAFDEPIHMFLGCFHDYQKAMDLIIRDAEGEVVWHSEHFYDGKRHTHPILSDVGTFDEMSAVYTLQRTYCHDHEVE